jgi:hypothetical protein
VAAPPPYGDFQVGGVLYPLPSSSSNTLLQDADPTLYYATDFLKSMIVQHVGGRLLSAASAAGISQIAEAVAATYPWPINPEQLNTQFPFPLLAFYRTSSPQYRWRTVGYNDYRTEIALDYVLPPLTGGQVELIAPILHAIEAMLVNRTVQGWDPSYTPPGGVAGQQPWATAFAYVEEIGFVRGSYGQLQGAGNLYFPTLHMEGFVVERDNDRTDVLSQTPFTGGDINVALTGTDGTTIADFIQVSTQPAPTITSLSVTSGTASGGTSVTITGTGFLKGPGTKAQWPIVLFGGNLAGNITWVSSTSITCTTPAMAGASSAAVPVSVTNIDGQGASLPSAFTFT